MNQGSKIFDDLGRLMNEAAGVADGARREIETMIRSHMERAVADLDLVKREQHEVALDLIRKQSEEIEALKKEVAGLRSKKKSA